MRAIDYETKRIHTVNPFFFCLSASYQSSFSVLGVRPRILKLSLGS